MKNTKGFSIVELMLAIAVSGMVLLAFLDVMQFIKILENRGRIRADARTVQTVGERFLWMGLKNSAPSFNSIPVLDDAGKNFFDLNRDVATGSIPAADLTRTYTMNLTGGKTTFLAILSESTVASVRDGYPETVILDPTKFYNIAVNADPNTVSLDWTMFRSYIAALNPNFFGKATQTLEVYVPSTFRNVGAAATTMPNSTSYFIRCSNVGSEACSTETFGSLISYHNAQNTSVAVSSLDNYLKTIPSASGGIPPILARVVRMVRYELRASTQSSYPAGIGDLYYTTWNGTAFASPVMVADRIQSIVFARPDITDPTITINLTPQDIRSRQNKAEGKPLGY